MAVPTLISARLIVREFTTADSDQRRLLIEDAFGQLVSDHDNTAWMQWCVLNYRILEKLYQPPYGDYAIIHRGSGILIGSVGLVPSVIPWGTLPQFLDAAVSPSSLIPEFGLFWAVHSQYRGNGYATEAATAFINYLFAKLNVRRLVATTERQNVQSQRVMRKLGMVLYENPGQEPHWFQVVGVLRQP